MDIQKVILEYTRFCDRYLNEGIIAYSVPVSTTPGEYNGIHMELWKFVERFKNYEINNRGTNEYPYQLYYIVNGVKFYALVSESEFAELEQRKCSK